MTASKGDIIVFSETEKVELLKHLENKGQKKPENWRLIHSELCGQDEEKFDIRKFLPKLSKLKFAIDIVSEPDLESFLDKGQIKVRYRYVLGLEHAGEREIKDNTREFCEALIRADKLYRREDINIMSFRGANPLAKQNYSIFRLQGHWNCRHAWQREIYFVENVDDSPESGELIDKKIAMSDNKDKNFVEKFLDLFKSSKVKLSKEEIVKINEVMLGEQKFLDAKDAEGRTMRIDGEEIAVDAAVAWIGEDGTESEVADGDYTLAEHDKIITVAGGKITAIKDISEDAEGDNGEGTQDVEARLAAVEKAIEELPKTIAASLKAELSKEGEDGESDIDKMVEEKVSAKLSKVTEELKKLPAFTGDKTSQKFSKTEDNNDDDDQPERVGIGKRLKADFKRPGQKD